MNPVPTTLKVQSKTWEWADPAVVAILAALGLSGNLVVAWASLRRNENAAATLLARTDLQRSVAKRC